MKKVPVYLLLVLGAAVLVVVLGPMIPRRMGMEYKTRQECYRYLNSLYLAVRAAHNTGSTSAAPFSAVELGGDEEMYCPVVAYRTNGEVRSALLVVYAVKRRGSDSWERPDVTLSPPYPIAFASKALDGDGDSIVYLSDGCPSTGELPIGWRDVAQQELGGGCRFGAVEITIPQRDSRFPYGETIASLRAQYLGKHQ